MSNNCNASKTNDNGHRGNNIRINTSHHNEINKNNKNINISNTERDAVGLHFCAGGIFRFLYIAMRPDECLAIGTMRRGE